MSHRMYTSAPSLTEEQRLTREVLVVLYATGDAYWSRCGGPERRNGLDEDALLLSLQTRFPSSAWDMSLLQDILSLGLRQGVFKSRTPFSGNCALVGPDPGTVGGPFFYYANDAMIIQNVANRVYFDVAPSRICYPCRQC